jgi:large subunit ribosomal protein L25
MKSVALKAFPRTLAGRGGVKKVRAQGRIPAVIYGTKNPPQSLEVDQKEFEKLLHHSVSENLLVDLAVDQDGKATRLALLQEVQHNPLSGKVVHVDLHEVDANEPVTISIPVETIGEPVGVRTGGGVLEHVVFKIRVRALPKNLPEFIAIEVAHLEVGKSVHLGEIKAPEGVELLGDKSLSIVAVALPKAEVEPEAAAAAAPATADVEMIKEKKDQPAGAAAPAGGAKAPAAAAAKAPAAAAKAPAGGKK